MYFALLTKYPNIQYGFSEKNDGSMHRRTRKHNREKYFKDIGINPDRVVVADLSHGSKAANVSEKDAGTMIVDTDGLITKTKTLFLSATAADCFLLYFYDPAKEAVGIVHAGWRGILAGVIENSVSRMVKDFATTPGDLLVGISPGIRQCHFEISPSDKDKFKKHENFILEKDGKIFVDLPGIIKLKLQYMGVREGGIEDSDLCTYCKKEKYFSYRRDHPKEVEVMMGYIGLA